MLITLGSLGADLLRVQTCIGEQQGLKLFICDCMLKNKMSRQKWGWSLCNLALNHPPNKADLVNYSGIALISNNLQLHATEVDIVRQGLSLLLCLLSNDPQAKFSLPKARRALLERGFVDLVDEVKKRFKGDEHITSISAALLNLIIKDWS